MGSFQQWRTAVDSGDLRRVTWVAGEQSVLVEEVVDTTRRLLHPSELDYVSLSYGPGFEQQVWAQANQYPLTYGANRMVLIRDADKLTRWGQLDTWMTRTRSLPGVYLVFVSDKPEQLSGKKGAAAHLACIKAPRGFLVRCSALAEQDALAWVQRRAPLSQEVAKYLLTRTGGNLSQAAAVCAKLALFGQGAGSATINAIVAESPAADFTDSLIALDKRRALMSVTGLDGPELIKAVALLDSRLDLLERLNRIHSAGRSWRDATGVNPFLLRQYMPFARHYDEHSCTARRRVLAVIDDVLRHGARDAVMEALVALW